jgi:hypothetical protein
VSLVGRRSHFPSFFSSSLHPVSPCSTSLATRRVLTSAAPQSPRWCRRHPSSPPRDAHCRQGSVSRPRSNLQHVVSTRPQHRTARHRVPSTGKSSNSSSSSSCAAGFLSWTCSPGLVESPAAFFASLLVCVAPDIVAGVWRFSAGEDVSG